MSRRGALDAIVVGAGVVGAAAALAFARDGMNVALVESREPPPWRALPTGSDQIDLRVYAFAPDNAALLDDLGVWRGVASARLQPYRAMRVWDAAGGGELVFDADRFGRRELGWIVEHALLVDRLWSALPAAGVQLHCPDSVVGLEQDADGASVQLESGRSLRGRIVVAADGAESKLRALAGIETSRRDYGQRGLVAFVESERPHRETCWQRFLTTGPLAFLPFDDARTSSIVWTLPDAEAARLLQADDAAVPARTGSRVRRHARRVDARVAPRCIPASPAACAAAGDRARGGDRRCRARGASARGTGREPGTARRRHVAAGAGRCAAGAASIHPRAWRAGRDASAARMRCRPMPSTASTVCSPTIR